MMRNLRRSRRRRRTRRLPKWSRPRSLTPLVRTKSHDAKGATDEVRKVVVRLTVVAGRMVEDSKEAPAVKLVAPVVGGGVGANALNHQRGGLCPGKLPHARTQVQTRIGEWV